MAGVGRENHGNHPTPGQVGNVNRRYLGGFTPALTSGVEVRMVWP